MRKEINQIVFGDLFLDSCPLKQHRDMVPTCRLNKKQCRYGLTKIGVPKHCPLRKGDIQIGLRRGLHDFDEHETTWKD